MKCNCEPNLERITGTQPSTTSMYTLGTSYYQCRNCGTLYHEIQISDSMGRVTKSGIVKYAGHLTKEEIETYMPKLRGVLRKKDTEKILGERK